MRVPKRDLPPGKLQWGSAPLLQLSKFKHLLGSPYHFHGDRVPMLNNFCSYINDPSANVAGIDTKFHNPFANILLERFVEKEYHKRRAIEGHIIAETLEGKLFKSKVLPCPMHQLIVTFAMIHTNDPPRNDHTAPSVTQKTPINRLTHSKVGVEDGLWPDKEKQHLPTFAYMPTKEHPREAAPASPPVLHLQIVLYISPALLTLSTTTIHPAYVVVRTLEAHCLQTGLILVKKEKKNETRTAFYENKKR